MISPPPVKNMLIPPIKNLSHQLNNNFQVTTQ